MRYLKKFENFMMADPSIKPTIAPTKPGITPKRRTGKPSPIRRDKPGVEPRPKALKDELPKASIEDVIEKFAKLTNQI